MKCKGTICFLSDIFNEEIERTKINLSLIISKEDYERISDECLKLSSKANTIAVKELESGDFMLKTHTSYAISIYENAIKMEEPELYFGNGSEVEVAFNLKDGSHRGTKYVTAYLKAINVLNAVERTEYNPFADE